MDYDTSDIGNLYTLAAKKQERTTSQSPFSLNIAKTKDIWRGLCEEQLGITGRPPKREMEKSF